MIFIFGMKIIVAGLLILDSALIPEGFAFSPSSFPLFDTRNKHVPACLLIHGAQRGLRPPLRLSNFVNSACSSDANTDLGISCKGVKLAATNQASEFLIDEDDDEPPKYEGTIFAQSTPVGVGGVAVVRVSGPDALESLRRLSSSSAKPPEPRYATLRTLRHPITAETLDKALILYFPKPKSFTGEDVVEYHLHGGIAVVNSVLEALGIVPGLRLAQRGEFTKRAYLNGQMDLLEAEALNDLIHAETSGQQKQAMKQISGAHRVLYQKWRTDILRNLAHVNAFIDYGESDGLDEDEVLRPVRAEAAATLAEIEAHLSDGRRGEAIRTGLRCTLVGPPNAGKSSLLNILAARPAAIVSATPGTTRDIVQVRLQLGGYPVAVDDTAGLRERTHDDIEREGMRRSAASFREADVRVLVLDGGGALSVRDCEAVVALLNTIEGDVEGTQAWLEEAAAVDKPAAGNWRWSAHRHGAGGGAGEGGEEEGEEEEGEESGKPLLVALNKADLCPSEEERAQVKERLVPLLQAALPSSNLSLHWLSCASREGVDALIGELDRTVAGLMGTKDDAPLVTRARHRELLQRCAKALRRFVRSEHPVDIQAEELSIAMDSVGKIYGEVDIEEVLDVVFRDFCIGK